MVKKTRSKMRSKHHKSRHHKSKHHKSKHHKSRHNKSRRVQRGGKYTPGGWNWSGFTPTWRTRNTFMPQSILNLGRSVITGGENLVNGWNGLPKVVSPYPTHQPDLTIKQKLVIPPNITAINKAAQEYVVNMK